ncbi:hypothetical protein GWI33_000296 [Rhynchophorus ferrugineus]|uniref:Uncharacterized protein n=1 Tax=Rhynchophorus ferrugineus TaxID=354439 RepID=A0A834HZK6_RHYFE|nr:hypothetical protein GWI33_000296 [Rhynchophorus ferrugineus]
MRASTDIVNRQNLNKSRAGGLFMNPRVSKGDGVVQFVPTRVVIIAVIRTNRSIKIDGVETRGNTHRNRRTTPVAYHRPDQPWYQVSWEGVLGGISRTIVAADRVNYTLIALPLILQIVLSK